MAVLSLQVLSKGHEEGPAGVEVSLRNHEKDETIQTVFTLAGGQYVYFILSSLL